MNESISEEHATESREPFTNADQATVNVPTHAPNLHRTVVAPPIGFVAAVGVLLMTHREGYSDLHTLLDTSIELASGADGGTTVTMKKWAR